MARRRSASRSLVGYGTLLAVVLLAPTLVVLTFMRSLPDSTSAGFKKHDEASGSGGSTGRVAAGAGPRLHEQLDADRSGSRTNAAKGTGAASLHAHADAVGQQQEQKEPPSAQAAEVQQQSPKQQQQQAQQQVRQGQVARGQAPLLPDEPPDPQQQAARKQRYAAKKAQQAQQQLQPKAVYSGPFPRWPSALPKGSGVPHVLPGCGDKDSPQRCADWARQGDCDTNPGAPLGH